jgi:hypothetical protein
MNNFDFKNFLTENKLTKTSVLREGLGAYEFEKGKKEGEAEEKKTMSKKALKQKIKEMILAEMELDINDNEADAKLDDFLDEAKKKKKDEEEELDLNLDQETPEGEEDLNLDFDATEEVPAEDTFNIDTSAVDPNIKAVQDALTQAQAAAEKIQDEKLTQQIGNTITMFTRTHIANKEPIR